MVEITLQVPDTLAERLVPVREQLPEILELVADEGLPLSARVYREVVEFMAARPTPEQIVDFHLSPGAQASISRLQTRNNDGTITYFERAELQRLLRVEHLMRTIKLHAREQLSQTPRTNPSDHN